MLQDQFLPVYLSVVNVMCHIDGLRHVSQFNSSQMPVCTPPNLFAQASCGGEGSQSCSPHPGLACIGVKLVAGRFFKDITPFNQVYHTE